MLQERCTPWLSVQRRAIANPCSTWQHPLLTSPNAQWDQLVPLNFQFFPRKRARSCICFFRRAHLAELDFGLPEPPDDRNATEKSVRVDPSLDKGTELMARPRSLASSLHAMIAPIATLSRRRNIVRVKWELKSR